MSKDGIKSGEISTVSDEGSEAWLRRFDKNKPILKDIQGLDIELDTNVENVPGLI